MRILHATAGKALGDGVHRAAASLAQTLKTLGVESTVLARAPGPGPTYRCALTILDSCLSPEAARRLLRYSHSHDIIHLHVSKPPSETLILASKLARKPVLATIHAFPYKYTGLFRLASHAYTASLVKALAAIRGPVVLPSRGVYEEHRRLLRPVEDKVVIIPHGAGPPPGSSPPQPSAPGMGAYAVFIGRFSEEKGFTTLILAARRALARSGRARLLLVGDGPLRWMAERLASLYPGRVRILGWVGQEEVYRILASSPGLVVSPSVAETYNFTLADSIYYGVPVVASRIGAHLDLLGPDYPGLAEPGDIEAYASHIEDPGRAADNLKPHVEEARKRLPSWIDTARRYLELYRGLQG